MSAALLNRIKALEARVQRLEEQRVESIESHVRVDTPPARSTLKLPEKGKPA